MRPARSWIAVAALFGTACALPFGIGDGIPNDVPGWLKTEIEEVKREPVANPPLSFWSYTYRDRTVYYRPPQCCDMPSTVRDASGAYVCSPDGGFTGTGDGKCRDFVATRRDERLIWKDRRTYP